MDPRPFYEAALTCLRFVEARTPTGRRFGPDADARWNGFRGSLTTADRVNLLLRDADAQYPGAFGARTVFNLRGVAEDEAFGAEWVSLTDAQANAIWKARVKSASPPGTEQETFAACAEALGLTLKRVTVGAVSPSSRLLLAGPSAIVATALAFAKGRDLSWSDQVTCVATPPEHRQIAVLAAAILNASGATKLVTPGAAGRLGRIDHVVTSNDADSLDLQFAQKRAS